jgi:cell division protein FtsL
MARQATARSASAGRPRAGSAGTAPVRPAQRPGGRSTRQVRRSARRAGPRRLSGPSPTRRPAFASAASGALPLLRSPFARGARAGGERVLDALLAGRGWIALVFVLLAGIVFFNVDLLQLNREIATTADRAADLRRSNAGLRLELAKLGSSERIQRDAAAAGFVLPPPGDVVYLRTSSRDPSRALKLITAPNPAPVIPPPAPAEIVEEPVTDTAAGTDPAATEKDPTASDPTATDPAATDPAAADPTTVQTPATTTPSEPAPVVGETGAAAAPPAG